jgi:hypothetical protein
MAEFSVKPFISLMILNAISKFREKAGKRSDYFSGGLL